MPFASSNFGRQGPYRAARTVAIGYLSRSQPARIFDLCAESQQPGGPVPLPLVRLKAPRFPHVGLSPFWVSRGHLSAQPVRFILPPMCGRYALNVPAPVFLDYFAALGEDLDWTPRLHLGPLLHPFVPAGPLRIRIRRRWVIFATPRPN